MMKFSAADPSTDPWAVAVIASWGLCNHSTFTSSFVKFITVPKCAWQFPGINNNKKKSETQIGEMYIDSAISVLFFPISR